MKQEKLYETIFKRQSIRSYKNESLTEKTLEKISSFIDNVESINEDIEIETKIVNGKVVRNLLPIKAPYYLLFFSEQKEGYLTNAGFMLQQVDLFLSHHGIGSCWVGLAKPKKEIKKNSDLEYVITLGFGKPDTKLHRESVKEFKRKSLNEIKKGKGKDQLIEAARLAPSATNNQPWFFEVTDDKINVYCNKPNFIKALFYKKINKIDIGIAICHIWLAARYFNQKPEIIYEEKETQNTPEGYYYISTVAPGKK